MYRGQRLTMLGIAAVIAVIAVVIALASGGDKSKDESVTSPASERTRGKSPGEPSTATATPDVPPKPPEPEIVRVRVRGGEPVGGVKEIEATAGDRVRITVASDVAGDLHLHGYDISREVAAGGNGRFDFKADIEGVFELELEQTSVPIAELTVKP